MPSSSSYWLMKSEPDVFSIDDLQTQARAPWDGVRNYLARNHMMKMKKGDPVLFYHSSTEPPGVAGLARVVRASFPDPTAWDPKSNYFDPRSNPEKPVWFMVEVEFVEKFPRFVPLDDLKKKSSLKSMMVTLRGTRLSVQPVTAPHFRAVCQMGGSKFPV